MSEGVGAQTASSKGQEQRYKECKSKESGTNTLQRERGLGKSGK